MREESKPAFQIFDGVYKVPDPRNPSKLMLATRNLSPGRSIYGEQLIKFRIDGDLVEFRSWDPFRSKLSASILNGLKLFPFRAGAFCLYLGASTGTTVSHLSDIVGEKGRVFGVEMAARVAREFLENVVKYRKNVVPVIADAKHPNRYGVVYGKIDVVYCDIAQPDQTEIAIANCREFLETREENLLFLVVKASSIDATKSKAEVFSDQIELLEKSSFKLLQKIDLEPYDRNHAMIVARPTS
jgi:fibrillarin-like pre-rRNA processing protein